MTWNDLYRRNVRPDILCRGCLIEGPGSSIEEPGPSILAPQAYASAGGSSSEGSSRSMRTVQPPNSAPTATIADRTGT